uniref:Uncharacterized protein n=1 Tax=Oryza sativa subsp. japonica TaxID=39947 RepID=Q67U39_ORYSJ|nr:hypothetical protein [Oryza sativa Japonica Group]BAD38332.1 hypothetical protein [Oryza sativa Japonica Group]
MRGEGIRAHLAGIGGDSPAEILETGGETSSAPRARPRRVEVAQGMHDTRPKCHQC